MCATRVHPRRRFSPQRERRRGAAAACFYVVVRMRRASCMTQDEKKQPHHLIVTVSKTKTPIPLPSLVGAPFCGPDEEEGKRRERWGQHAHVLYVLHRLNPSMTPPPRTRPLDDDSTRRPADRPTSTPHPHPASIG